MHGMPPELLEEFEASLAWDLMLQVAPTLAYDTALLDRNQNEPWRTQWASVTMPVLVMLGEVTPPNFRRAAEALVAALPDARSRTIAGANHRWQFDAMRSELVAFLTN